MNSVVGRKGFSMKALSLALLLGLVQIVGASQENMLRMTASLGPKKTNIKQIKQTYTKRYQAISLFQDQEAGHEEKYQEQDLEDYYDVQIFSKVHIGSQNQEFEVIYDTGSAWFWVQDAQCSTCPTQNRFDSLSSTTFNQTRKMPNYIQYGTGAVVGRIATDDICLASKQTCASDVSMMVIDQAYQLSGLSADGIMGMAPSSQREGADLMVQKLYDQKAISENIFSFQVGTIDGTSHVTIGGYDLDAYALPNSTLQWHNLVNNFWWTLNMTGAKIGGQDLGISTKQVIIDTGTSYTLMPTSDFAKIQTYFKDQGHDCTFDTTYFNQFICQCTEEQLASYPNLEVFINGMLYSLAPPNYIDRTMNLCMFKVMTIEMSGDQAFWIMGLTFFQNYYTVFDLGKQRVGFAESKLSILGNYSNVEMASANVTIANATVLVSNLITGPSIHNQKSAEIAFIFLGIMAMILIAQLISFFGKQNYGDDSGNVKVHRFNGNGGNNDPENGLHRPHNPNQNLI